MKNNAEEFLVSVLQKFPATVNELLTLIGREKDKTFKGVIDGGTLKLTEDVKGIGFEDCILVLAEEKPVIEDRIIQIFLTRPVTATFDHQITKSVTHVYIDQKDRSFLMAGDEAFAILVDPHAGNNYQQILCFTKAKDSVTRIEQSVKLTDDSKNWLRNLSI